MVASTAVMPSIGPALVSAPTSTGRRPIEAPRSATSFLASASPPQRRRSHSIACSPAESSWAAMWWKAATTRASAPSSSWASSAAEPCGGGVNRRPPPKVSGTTVLTTTLPRQVSRSSGSVAARRLAGTVSTTTSALAAASRLDLASTRPPLAASSAALARARSPDAQATSSIGLAKQIARRVAQERPARALATRPVEPAHDGHRYPVELAHHRLRGGGELVGEGQDGGLQHVPGGILLAEIAHDRLEAGDAHRHVHEALAPRPAEGVRHDDRQIVAGQGLDRGSEPGGGAIRVFREQTRGIRVHVGLVHARVGAHEALAGLDDEHVLGLADDAPALPQDHLHEARIATDLPRDRLGLGGHAHLREAHHAPLGLGDDLLAHHQQVARLERRALTPGRVDDERGQRVAPPDLGEALDRDDLVARWHG